MTKLKAHPLADRMPEMTPAEYAGLKASIAANGQRRPIVLFEGKILDGRHRYRACIELGIEPKFVNFKGDYAAAEQLVIDEAMHRHMTDGQKATAAEAFISDFEDYKKEDCKFAVGALKSADEAALRFGVSARSIFTVRAIRKGAPDLYSQIRTGSLNINQANNRMKQQQRLSQTKRVNRKASTAGVIADHEIRTGDTLQLMEAMPAGKVRAVFWDPPYNNGWKYHADPTKDARPDDEYVDWIGQVLRECLRLLTDDGSIFVLIDDANSDFVGIELRAAGFHRQACIVWWETFANHNSAETGLTCRTRYIHYYTKAAEGFVFNTDVRVRSARQEVYKDPRANPSGMVPSNVWQISRKQGTANDRVPFADAPPQVPAEVIERCILLASEPGDLIFDPTAGNGTTAVAAGKNGRRSLGCERSPKYAKQARQWIASQLEGKR